MSHMLKHSIRYLQGSLTYFTQHIIAILILFSQYSNFLQFAFDFISIGTSMASSILRKYIVILAHLLTNLQKLPLLAFSVCEPWVQTWRAVYISLLCVHGCTFCFDMSCTSYLPYSWKIWWGIKFGSLTVGIESANVQFMWPIIQYKLSFLIK